MYTHLEHRTLADHTEKEIPLAIRHAMAALEIVRAENPDLAMSLESILPSYAMRQSQSGNTVNVDSLLRVARQGPDSLKEAFALAQKKTDRTFAENYKDIVASLAKNTALLPPHLSPLAVAMHLGKTEDIIHLLDSRDPSAQPRSHTILAWAIKNGHISLAQSMIERYADFSAHKNMALGMAATHGHVEFLGWLLDRGARAGDGALQTAARNGHTETVRFLLDRGADIRVVNNGILRAAAASGYIEAVRLLLQRGADINALGKLTLRDAVWQGHTEIVRFLLDNGVELHETYGSALNDAAQRGHTNIVQALLDHRAPTDTEQERATRRAVFSGHSEVVSLFIKRGIDLVALDKQKPLQVQASKLNMLSFLGKQGLDLSNLSKNIVDQVNKYDANVAHWEKTVRFTPSLYIAQLDPRAFKPALFADLAAILKSEGYKEIRENHPMAYAPMALLQNEKRVLQYLQKWGEAGHQPLHDLIHMIRLPDDLSNINLAAWGDALLQHGPKMARLVKFSDRLPQPLRSEDNKSWSYLRTRAEVAKFAYKRAAEHPQLAALCFENAVSEGDFNKALDIAQAVPPKVRDMPDITIDGKRFGLEGATFHKLANDDVRGLFLGELTDCCQSIGNAGSGCATHGYTSPNGGFYVVETVQGEIIGQSWAWRGEKRELCLDSLETLGNRVSQQQWQDLLKEIAQDLTTRKNHGVSALHVGTGGATPKSLSQHFEQASAKPVDYSGYRDSKTQIRVWKR